MTAPQTLPTYFEWHGSPEWRAHLLDEPGHDEATCHGCAVRPKLTAIYHAWYDGDLTPMQRHTLYGTQDGYGTVGYVPEQGVDWSGIRDSSPAAIDAMYRLLVKWGKA